MQPAETTELPVCADGKGRVPDSDPEFRGFVVEHFCYELWMLAKAQQMVVRLKTEQPLNMDGEVDRLFLSNLVTESIALHSRLLHEFLTDDKGYGTDAKAADLRSGEVNRDNRRREAPQNIEALTGFDRDRANKEIVHLSYLRYYRAETEQQRLQRSWMLDFVPRLSDRIRSVLDEEDVRRRVGSQARTTLTRYLDSLTSASDPGLPPGVPEPRAGAPPSSPSPRPGGPPGRAAIIPDAPVLSDVLRTTTSGIG